MSASATPAIALVRAEAVAHEVHAYEVPAAHGRARDARPDYGLEAAAALGVDPARVGKTLVVLVDGRPAVAVVPVDRQLDLKRFAAALDGRRAELAEPGVAERAAGSVVGGISPLGMRLRLPTIIDASVLEHRTVHVSAGRRGLQLELAPADLVQLCAATIAPIAR
ncbi:MAG TPA: aminoacyl-tRNA deacylase [Candidatus Saccharimonadales bacterium]|nr:aminoacyl-tRNA deacylase [Candidatus Saccharimonadales bacterium]